MKIAVLTSSRADYGIYLPLLNALRADDFFDLHIIAFGTHLSRFHGYTIDQIRQDGFVVDHEIDTILAGDSEGAISSAMGLTQLKFASVWKHADYDLVFCLGDRYEMFAAVSAAVPYGIKFGHIHGGETTLGSIDNKFRHCLSIFSSIHFTAAEQFSARVKEIIGSDEEVHNVGSLSIDYINSISLFSLEAFKAEFNIDLEKPTVLVTFHPETVSPEKNKAHTCELIGALNELKYQIVITMPNADTSGNYIRELLQAFAKTKKNVICIENFGSKGYFTIMKHCLLLIGNTSSGIIEAASFNKYVINIGDRQKGRLSSKNVFHVQVNKMEIIKKVEQIESSKAPAFANIYYNGGAVKKVIERLKMMS